MRASLSEESEDVDIKIDGFINTFGGEYWDDDYQFSDYGVQLGNLSISKLTPEEFKDLGIKIINHLMSNGHGFEIRNDRNGNGEYLKGV